MTRRILALLVLPLALAALGLVPALVRAEGEPPAAPNPPASPEAAPPAVPGEAPAPEAKEPAPPMVSDEEAGVALEAFKKEYQARGFKGDEKTAVRERAMRRLAEVQHPTVTDQLYKLTKDRDPDIRTLAVMYLGEQRALPGYAGRLVVKALNANKTDAVLVMFAVEAILNLDYRAAVPTLRELMRHKDDMVSKVVILTIGDMVEMRMLEDILLLAKDLKIDKGWKTEGHEVRYDSGAEGDHDQKMAEKIYREKYGNSAKKARSSGRAMRDLRPILLEALKRLTGEEFEGRAAAEAWAEVNKDSIEATKKALDETAAQQEAQADAL